MRVVSLLPSATEILCRIGARDLLVGRGHECDFPPGIEHLPVLTGQTTHYDPASGVTARDIDEAVREQMTNQQPLYRLDTAKLADLRPDVILTQEVCHVCSIDGPTVRTVARHMLQAFGRQPQVISLDATTIEGVLDDHLKVGVSVHRQDAARDAVTRLRERLFRAEEHVPAFASGPVVGFMEWTDPIYVAGHWTVELIERAGGRHPLNASVADRKDGAAAGPQRGARHAGPSPSVSAEAFAASEPQALIIAPCGLTLDQAWHEAERLSTRDWFRTLPAVRAGRVAVVDGSAMFNRPGPRLIDAFEWLVGWLHDRPELIPADFPWRTLPAP